MARRGPFSTVFGQTEGLSEIVSPMRELLNELGQLLTWKTGAGIAAKGIIGLATFLLGVVARWAWAWAKARYAAHKANRLWRPMLDAHIVIVTAVFASPADRAFEQSGLMGVGDARALTALEDWFKSIRFRDYELRYSHDTSGEVLKRSNLICIGGPDANFLTRDALGRLELIADILERPDVPKASFRNEGEGLDYATVCFVPSPYADERRILFLFGEISGYGTWAATKSVTTKPIAMPKFGIGGFSAFLRTEVVLKHPQHVSLLDFRPIAERSRAEEAVVHKS